MYTKGMAYASTAAPTSASRDERSALAGLALDELGKATGGVHKIHRAVTDRVFSILGMHGGAIRPVHDAITDLTYDSIVAGLTGSSRVADHVMPLLAGRRDSQRGAPSETAGGAFGIAVLNGLIGDRLAADRSTLAITMAPHRQGSSYTTDRDTLARMHPDATDHLVVFLHGLMETEFAWGLGSRPTYGDLLCADISATPVDIRYNTGLHVSDNGRRLSRLIAELAQNWPVPIRTIDIVGHSMGGLVARSACHHGLEEEAQWIPRVRHVVYLGSPHLGAPAARGVHYLSAALDRAPETQPIARLLRRRSAGIRDLFHGHLTDDDWSTTDPDAFYQMVSRDVDLLPTAEHLVVMASVTRSPRHPIGRIIGDGLVRAPSASGRNKWRHVGFHDDASFEIGSANHFTLLNNREIYEWLVERLRPRPELPCGTSAHDRATT